MTLLILNDIKSLFLREERKYSCYSQEQGAPSGGHGVCVRLSVCLSVRWSTSRSPPHHHSESLNRSHIPLWLSSSTANVSSLWTSSMLAVG